MQQWVAIKVLSICVEDENKASSLTRIAGIEVFSQGLVQNVDMMS